jgi:hypothetical protein
MGKKLLSADHETGLRNLTPWLIVSIIHVTLIAKAGRKGREQEYTMTIRMSWNTQGPILPVRAAGLATIRSAVETQLNHCAQDCSKDNQEQTDVTARISKIYCIDNRQE